MGFRVARAPGWCVAAALVVLATRWVVYALAPPTLVALQLQRSAGGPRLVSVALVALGLGVGISAAAVWLASIALRERIALDPAVVVPPPPRTARMAARFLALWTATSFGFAMFESYLHWRAGLGWHGLHCLVGPVHRDAIPILAALSLVAVALHRCLEHVVAWMRRTIRRLLASLRPRRRRTQGLPVPTNVPLPPGRIAPGSRPRGPPTPFRTVVLNRYGRRKPMNRIGAGRRCFAVLLVLAAFLAVGVGSAWAHARISPVVVESKQLQLFSLAVPTEKEKLTTTKIELTVPQGFGIDSFVPSPGWTRQVQQTGSGEDAVIQKVTWSGGKVPTEEDSLFQFLASPSSSKTYTFQVRQTYSDGSVVDWSGPESSDSPSPTIEAKDSLGGGGSSTLAIVALILGGAALVVAIVGLVSRRGGRSLA